MRIVGTLYDAAGVVFANFDFCFCFLSFFFSMKFSSSVRYANVHYKLREIVKMIDPFFLGK